MNDLIDAVLLALVISAVLLLGAAWKLEHFTSLMNSSAGERWLYWGAWSHGSGCHASTIDGRSIPVGTTGVVLCFCNLRFITNSTPYGIGGLPAWNAFCPPDMMTAWIAGIHSAGAKAYLACGGPGVTVASAANQSAANQSAANQSAANQSAANQSAASGATLAQAAAQYALDGIDIHLTEPDSDPNAFMEFCQAVRAGVPSGVSINLTVPAGAASGGTLPWALAIQNPQVFHTVSIQCYGDGTGGSAGYDPADDMRALMKNGWTASQIILTLAPTGQNDAEIHDLWTRVAAQGLRGAALWNAQRDTQAPNICVKGGETVTGMPDGTYARKLAQGLL